MPEFDRTLLIYQDRLRAWGIQATLTAWAGIDPDNIDESFRPVAALVQAIYAQATIATLDAVDEYMTLVAADAGKNYRASWRAGDRAGDPGKLPSGASFQQWLSHAPPAMKAAIGKGLDPAAAADLSLRRTAAEVATTVYQRPRETTFNRFLVDSLVARSEPIPAELDGFYREVETYANQPRLWDGRSARAYKPTWERWRRVPSPGACSWCLMLATRSNYTSADAAMYAGGGEGQVRKTTKDTGNKNVLHGAGVQRRRSNAQQSGERYHRSCRCTVAMSSSSGKQDEGTSIAIDPDHLDDLIARGENVVTVGGYSYDLATKEILDGEGIPLPERAPWADAWRESPRQKSDRVAYRNWRSSEQK